MHIDIIFNVPDNNINLYLFNIQIEIHMDICSRLLNIYQYSDNILLYSNSSYL